MGWRFQTTEKPFSVWLITKWPFLFALVLCHSCLIYFFAVPVYIIIKLSLFVLLRCHSCLLYYFAFRICFLTKPFLFLFVTNGQAWNTCSITNLCTVFILLVIDQIDQSITVLILWSLSICLWVVLSNISCNYWTLYCLQW